MKQDIKPKVIAFEVTRKCRFHCPHCRADASQNCDNETLTTNQCKNIIDSVCNYSKPTLIITGGEPMERQDIYELAGYAHNAGLKVAMATCGYLIDEQAIKKMKKAGIDTLSFSLDGSSAETHDLIKSTPGAFDIILNAAKLAKKAGIRFQINMVVTKTNIDEIVGVYEMAHRLGAYCFNPFILVPTGRAKELEDMIVDPVDYETLINELVEMKLENTLEIRVTCGPQFARICKQKRMEKLSANVNGCMGGKGFGFISFRGDVQICGFLDISAGNLVENKYDFKKIWTESEFLNKIRSKDFKGACGNCEYTMICGGCRARAYSVCADYMASDPICSYANGGKKVDS